MSDKPQTVTVEAIKYHTNAGKAYEIGDTYDVSDYAVDSLAANGFAIRVDRKAAAKQAKQVATPSRVARGKATKRRK